MLNGKCWCGLPFLGVPLPVRVPQTAPPPEYKLNSKLNISFKIYWYFIYIEWNLIIKKQLHLLACAPPGKAAPFLIKLTSQPRRDKSIWPVHVYLIKWSIRHVSMWKGQCMSNAAQYSPLNDGIKKYVWDARLSTVWSGSSNSHLCTI
jgi:hypothetical protein